MKRRFGWLLGLVTILLGWLLVVQPGTVWAAPALEGEGPHRGGHRAAFGRITALGDHSFTLALARGTEITVQVTDETRFRTPEGEASFADLQVGNPVAVVGRRDEQSGALVARVVVILPPDFVPGERFGARALGKVTAVDAEAGSFTLHTRRGEDLTVRVDEHTRFRGVASLVELQPGMFAAVGGQSQEDGTLLARVVLVRRGRLARRFAGRVVAVDAEAGTFDLQTRRGDTLTFHVTDETRYRGQVSGLSDLQPGMAAVVGARRDADGHWVAVMVAAGERPEATRLLGKITAVDAEAGTFDL